MSCPTDANSASAGSFRLIPEFSGLSEVCLGLGPFALTLVGVAPVVVGFRQSGVEPDRFREVGDGFVEITLVASVDDASVVVGPDVFGLKPDRFGVIGDGFVRLALPS
jgi:hypothetical protein